MSDTAHTPPPWKVYRFGGIQVGQSETGEAICAMWGDENEGDANATHIVKCVNTHNDLVEALTRLVREADLDGMREKAGWDCWLNLADKALEKAGAA